MKNPNVRIVWHFDGALVFVFDFDNGKYIYHYRPEDRNIDVDSKSSEYDRAEWYIGESENLRDYLDDQVTTILQRFTAVVQNEFQNGYVDMFQVHEETEYAKHHS